MSSNSRTPFIGVSHSEDRSYNSNDSNAIVRRSSSSCELSDSVGSHNSYTSRGRKIINSPQAEDGNQSVRIAEVAETDPLVSEPTLLQRDGSSGAAEPEMDDEDENEPDELALIRVRKYFSKIKRLVRTQDLIRCSTRRKLKSSRC